MEESAQPEPPPPLSAAPEGVWGVGGKEEGKFAPQGKTGALQEDEDEIDENKGARMAKSRTSATRPRRRWRSAIRPQAGW